MTDITKEVQTGQNTESIPDTEAYYIGSVSVIDTQDGSESSGVMPIRVNWNNVIIQDLLDTKDNLDLSLKDLLTGGYQYDEEGKFDLGTNDFGFLKSQSLVSFINTVKENYDKEFWGVYDSDGEWEGSLINYNVEKKSYSLKEYKDLPKTAKDLIGEERWNLLKSRLSSHSSLMLFLLDRNDFWATLPDEPYDAVETTTIANKSDIASLFT